MAESVIIVTESDQMIGTMDKIAAHRFGVLHRAFSVFVFNSKGELLIQQRALSKYHSGGLWTNTCCSHPRPGEQIEHAAHRRLQEEMTLNCTLQLAFKFLYKAQVSPTLTEHEFDHVFFGVSDQIPQLNPAEASDFKYINTDELALDLKANPTKYSQWLNICFDKVMENYRKLQP